MILNEIEYYLGKTKEELEEKGGLYTAKEIFNQPCLWKSTFNSVKAHKEKLGHFLNNLLKKEDLDIILSGAGTSSFIGNILQGPFHKNTNRRTRSIPSTELVTHPESFFQNISPTLLISFARSGNSPESIAAIDLANELCPEIYHLIITCNPDGNLAKRFINGESLIYLLPIEAADLGLAMTGSFTSMLLTGLLLSQLNHLSSLEKQMTLLVQYGENLLRNYTKQLEEIAKIDFKRAVFLGSGPLLGTAQESQLKLQELTDGKVICKYDSFLSFRHGPKAVVDSTTLIVYLFSNVDYVNLYEQDLVKTIKMAQKDMYTIAIGEANDLHIEFDLKILLSSGHERLSEEFLTICSVLPAQILGFFKSLDLGLSPDSPSVSGTITRVVQGVVIYPFNKGKSTVS